MTISRIEGIKCPKCEKSTDVQLWDTINVTLDPEEKVNLFNGKINFFTCKYCDFKAPIPKSLLYHDMINKFWIYYFPINLITDDEFIKGNFTYEGKLKNLTHINETFEYMSNPIIVFSMQELKNHIYFRDRLLEVEEQDAETWSDKARVLTDQGMYDEAIQILDKAIEIDPTWATPWYNRGIILDNQNKFDEAIQAYGRAIELDPKFEAAWNNRGETLRKQGKYEDAINDFNEAIKIDPNELSAWYNKGIALYNQDKYDEAIDAFNEVIKINPQYAEGWNFTLCTKLVN